MLATPGPYSLKGDRTLRALFESLGEIGTQVGHEIIVIRAPAQGGGEVDAPASVPIPPEQAKAAGAEVFRVSLRELRWGNPEKNMALQAGDTIYFPKPAQINVMGNVAKPGSYKFEEGLTVQELLNQAGGVTAKGSWGGVRIFRFVDGKRKKIKPKLEDVVQPGDTVEVPEKFLDHGQGAVLRSKRSPQRGAAPAAPAAVAARAAAGRRSSPVTEDLRTATSPGRTAAAS